MNGMMISVAISHESNYQQHEYDAFSFAFVADVAAVAAVAAAADYSY